MGSENAQLQLLGLAAIGSGEAAEAVRRLGILPPERPPVLTIEVTQEMKRFTSSLENDGSSLDYLTRLDPRDESTA